MRLMGSPRSSAQQRTQRANVFHLFQSPDQLAEPARPRPADHRRDESIALGVDFGARHWIFRGAAHRPGMVPEFASVAQPELDDALPARPGLRQRIVAAQLDTATRREAI